MVERKIELNPELHVFREFKGRLLRFVAVAAIGVGSILTPEPAQAGYPPEETNPRRGERCPTGYSYTTSYGDGPICISWTPPEVGPPGISIRKAHY